MNDLTVFLYIFLEKLKVQEQLAQNEKLETRLEEAEKTVTSSREELESSRKEFDARLEESQQQISLLEEQVRPYFKFLRTLIKLHFRPEATQARLLV